jgi:hypothetical protein
MRKFLIFHLLYICKFLESEFTFFLFFYSNYYHVGMVFSTFNLFLKIFFPISQEIIPYLKLLILMLTAR